MSMSTSEPASLYEALISQLSDAVIFTDREGLIRVWNAGAQALFGQDAHDVIGEPVDVIIPERLRAAHRAGFEAAIRTGQTRNGRGAVTTRSMHRDGRALYVDMSFAVVKDGAGQVLGAVAVARDITERFHVEKDTRKRHAKLETQVRRLLSAGHTGQ
jgi:PAS domain S-box-containing protein